MARLDEVHPETDEKDDVQDVDHETTRTTVLALDGKIDEEDREDGSGDDAKMMGKPDHLGQTAVRMGESKKEHGPTDEHGVTDQPNPTDGKSCARQIGRRGFTHVSWHANRGDESEKNPEEPRHRCSCCVIPSHDHFSFEMEKVDYTL